MNLHCGGVNGLLKYNSYLYLRKILEVEVTYSAPLICVTMASVKIAHVLNKFAVPPKNPTIHLQVLIVNR